MPIIGWFMGSKLGRAIGSLLAAAALILAVFQAGRFDRKKQERIENLEDYVETKKEIDNVEASPDSTAAFERLRRNGWLR